MEMTVIIILWLQDIYCVIMCFFSYPLTTLYYHGVTRFVTFFVCFFLNYYFYLFILSSVPVLALNKK